MATGMRINWIGTRALQGRLTLAAVGAPIALAAALYIEAQRIMYESVRITPIATGSLRASGHVDPPDISPRGAAVELGYGGAAAPYALFVHEIMDAYHRPPTQAKFLERPMLEAAPQLAARLGLALKGASKGLF